MKITRVEAIHLRLPNVNERCDGSQETLVVKVHTDAGLSGVGEVDSSALVAKAIIEAPLSHKICRGLAECVVGENPLEIERLIHRMYEGTIFFGRHGAVIQAMSGVEIALWDIAGKANKQPVYRLLGGSGAADLICYASLIRYSDLSLVRANVRRALDSGFHSLKLHGIELSAIRAAREEAGPAAPLPCGRAGTDQIERYLGRRERQAMREDFITGQHTARANHVRKLRQQIGRGQETILLTALANEAPY